MASLLAYHLIDRAVGHREEYAEAVRNAVRLAEAQASMKRATEARRQDCEEEVLLRAACLQLDVQRALGAVNQHTLDLSPESEDAGRFCTTLVTARNAIQALRSGKVSAPQPDPEPPTLKEFRRWQDRVINQRLGCRAQARDEVAELHQRAEPAPARWSVSTYHLNGYVEASCAADADVYSTFSAWVQVPEAVENLLRRWAFLRHAPSK